jgi:hypothetical protein
VGNSGKKLWEKTLGNSGKGRETLGNSGKGRETEPGSSQMLTSFGRNLVLQVQKYRIFQSLCRPNLGVSPRLNKGVLCFVTSSESPRLTKTGTRIIIDTSFHLNLVILSKKVQPIRFQCFEFSRGSHPPWSK